MRRKNLRNVLCIVTAVAMGISSMFSAAPIRAAASETGQNMSEPRDTSGTEAPAQYECIKGLADETLYDTDGNPVRACGGEVHEFTENGEAKWYWFGEDVPSTTDDGTARSLHLYSSTDLYNWEKEEDIFRGMVSKDQFETDDYFKSLYGDLTDQEKDTVFECLQDCPTAHPKVFYNKKTHKYVMWVPGRETKMCIATSDSIKGPFKFEKYCEDMSGFVMAYQESNSAVYIINRNNMGTIAIAKLTDDYMDIANTRSVEIADAAWNAGSEGAITKRNGKYYMVNSATKQYAVADSLYGTWTVHPLQMCDEDGEISEVSEMNPTSCILPVSTDDGDVYINITEKWDATAIQQPAPEKIRYTWQPLMFSEDGTVKLGKVSNWKLDSIVHREPPVSTEDPAQYECIKGLADETLYATDGNPVRACGGEVHEFTENGETKWYWFGEDVPSTTDDGTARSLHLYSSTDLYNWEKEEDIFRGMVSKEQFETDDYFKNLYGDLTDQEKDIVFECLQDCPTAHPKVFYNTKSRQYVMWVPDKGTKMCIATSDSIKGPFKFEKYCEDMSGFVMTYQDNSGEVYIIHQTNPGTLVMAKLTEDYMDIANTRSVEIADAAWNAGSEGAITERNGKYYMVNSGTKQYAVADSLYGTWTVHPLQMCDEEGEISETSEMNPTSCILLVSTDDGDVYINITEKWDNTTVQQSAAEKIRYTWLPIKFFDDDIIALEKLSNWRLGGDDFVEVEEVTLTETSKTLKVGDAHQIIAYVLPVDATDQTLTYTSSDESVATVSDSGEVVAGKIGETIITVTSVNGKTAQLHVIVEEAGGPTQNPVETGVPTQNPVATEGPTQNPAATGEPTQRPTATERPTQDPTATERPTQNPVATEGPTQSPVATEGPTQNPVATEGPTQKPVATGEPTVEPIETEIPTKNPVATGGPTVEPIETEEPTENPVSTEEPTVKPIETEEPTQKPAATAKPTQKPTATPKPTAGIPSEKPPVEVARVILIEKGITLKVGDAYQIKVVVLPADAADKTLTYTSSDKSVATVSASGRVKALKAGKATITVTSANGKKAYMQLTVEKNPHAAQRILVSEKNVTMGVGEKVQLEAVVYPENASNKKLTYQASNNKVKVNGKGKITAEKPGKCKITISLPNGESAVVTVTVKKKPTELSLNATKKTLKVGKKFQIKPRFPKGTTSNKVTFVSSKEAVAAVSKNGKVTAKKKGNAVIVVKTYNGIRAVLKIHVK